MTHLNEFTKWLFVGLFKLRLDLYHIDLTARHNGPCQTQVIGAKALHRPMQRLGKLRDSVVDAADCEYR